MDVEEKLFSRVRGWNRTKMPNQYVYMDYSEGKMSVGWLAWGPKECIGVQTREKAVKPLVVQRNGKATYLASHSIF